MSFLVTNFKKDLQTEMLNCILKKVVLCNRIEYSSLISEKNKNQHRQN